MKSAIIIAVGCAASIVSGFYFDNYFLFLGAPASIFGALVLSSELDAKRFGRVFKDNYSSLPYVTRIRYDFVRKPVLAFNLWIFHTGESVPVDEVDSMLAKVEVLINDVIKFKPRELKLLPFYMKDSEFDRKDERYRYAVEVKIR